MRPASTHTQRVLELLRKEGRLRTSDLAAAGVPRMVLTRMTASGQLERAAEGCTVYRKASTPSMKAW